MISEEYKKWSSPSRRSKTNVCRGSCHYVMLPLLISFYNNYLSHLDIPCWYFCIRLSYLPSAMSWTSWSARLSSLVKNS